jgi:hypothetical protein
MTDTVLDSELPARRRRRLITPVTTALLAVVLVALGFTGGVLVQKSAGGTTTASATGGPPGLAGGGGGGGGGQGGGGAQPTIGQVTSKDGRALYVKGPDGTTVKVRVDAHAKVARTANASVKAIRPGDTVVVEGAKSANGTVKATSVTATASGVQSAGGRGFGRGGPPPDGG